MLYRIIRRLFRGRTGTQNTDIALRLYIRQRRRLRQSTGLYSVPLRNVSEIILFLGLRAKSR